MKNIFVIFAPVCQNFYVDICLKIVTENPNIKINGIFFENKNKIKKYIDQIPKANIGKIFFFADDEIKIINNKNITSQDDFVDNKNIINRMISADRIAGSGYMQNINYRAKFKYGSIFLKDNQLPRKYCISLYQYVEDILNKIRPTIVFSHSVASALTLAFFEISTKNKIKYITPKHTRFYDFFVLEDYQIGSIKSISDTFTKIKDNLITNNKSKEATQLYNNLIKKKILPEYYLRNKKEKSNLNSFYLFLKGIKRLIYSLFKLNYKGHYLRQYFFDFITSINQNNFNWKKKLPNKYIYFPLHVDPEASTMVESYLYTNQIFVIEAISKSIPIGYSLVVKEHIPMLGLRDKIFYKRIENLPNVILIDPYFHPYELIKKSNLTISITGTVSWESACLGIPSIVLDKVPHLLIENGISYLDNFKDLHSMIKKKLRQKIHNPKIIIQYISSILINGFKLESGFLWGNYHMYNKSKKKYGVDIMYKNLKKFL